MPSEPRIELRKVILFVLLGSLASSAAAGVVAALLQNDEVVVRVMWTGFTTAFMAAVGLAVSALLTRERTRPAALFGLSLLVFEFLLTLTLIWFEPVLASGRDDDVALTMLFAALVGVPTMLCVLLVGWSATRIAGFVGVGAGALAFGTLMLGTWQRSGGWGVDDQLAATGGTLGGVGAVLVAGLVGLRRDDMHGWTLVVRAAAGLMSVAAVVVILAAIWADADVDELTCLTLSLAMLAAYVNLLHAAPLRGRQRWVGRASLGAATATVACVNLLVLTDGSFAADLFERLAAAAGVVTASGSMAVLVLVAFNRRMVIEERSATQVTLTIVCPRCQRKQRVPVGRSACSGCHLRMHIRIEEPVCAGCGYLLHQLTSDRCPECGRPIGTETPAADRG